jgi:phosphoenolpyruvate carboxykinase (ATP)
VPVAVSGVDSKILNPRDTWSDTADYDATAEKLVNLFNDNFAKFLPHVDQSVRDSAPAAATGRSRTESRPTMPA